jgi:predicted MFS family arabinose efflux permease
MPRINRTTFLIVIALTVAAVFFFLNRLPMKNGASPAIPAKSRRGGVWRNLKNDHLHFQRGRTVRGVHLHRKCGGRILRDA